MPSANSKQLNPYIVADLCYNHSGDIDRCKEMILEAKKAGCNAVKIQSLDYNDANIAKSLETMIETEKYGKISFGDLAKLFILSDEEHKLFADHCKELKIDFISTIYGFRHIDLLYKLGVDKYKIASQDLIHLKLIEEVAKKQRPIIISVGMGTIGEIERAIKVIRKFNCQELSLLYCISQYPPKDSEMNLRRILSLKNIFNIKIGFSDHTLGITAAIVAATLGADIIEKHYTYDKAAEGWDHAIAADYDEMKVLCEEVRRARLMLGDTFWNVPDSEMLQRKKMRRSVVTKRKLMEGDILTKDCFDFKRPGTGVGPEEIEYPSTGIRPDQVDFLLGRRVNRNIEADELIMWDDLVR